MSMICRQFTVLRVLFPLVLLATCSSTAYLGVHCERAVQSTKKPQFPCAVFARDDSLANRAYQKSWAGLTSGPDGASALFEAALRGNPASPYRWCDLGESLLDSGQPETGRRCMVRAVELGPHMPQILLRAANFHFRLGDTDAALGYAARVLAMVPDYDAIIFNSYSRLDVGTDAVLNRGLPHDSRAVQAYFRYTLSSGTPEDAASVWAWMRRNSLNDDRSADDYAGFLIRRHLYQEAAGVWAAQMGTREEGYLKSNWLCNGDFSRDPSGAIFDWRITPVAGVDVSRDASGTGAGQTALRIEFPGTANLAYQNVEQTAFVQPGSYRFSARMRTAAITTDECVGFRVFDRENPGRLDIHTQPLRGTTDWTKVETVFRVSAGSNLLVVQVFRAPSLKFDNKIQGTVWITDVKLERVDSSKKQDH